MKEVNTTNARKPTRGDTLSIRSFSQLPPLRGDEKESNFKNITAH